MMKTETSEADRDTFNRDAAEVAFEASADDLAAYAARVRYRRATPKPRALETGLTALACLGGLFLILAIVAGLIPDLP